jgi:hypothetical protein
MTEIEILAEKPTVSQTRGHFRDELNFAEFPLAALADTIPRGQKTLVYTDTIFDRGRNEPVNRKLTITASDEYGLPTALDDEVILGLVQLTAKSNFGAKKVHFTRYELIKELEWRDETKSYERIEQSLRRWLGVTLYYDKAWWSKEESCWVNESFHILEQVTLFDKERRERRRRANPEDTLAGKSSFVWNEVVFNSFKSGYLKQLDFDLYKRLKSPIAKRMYRFLDKRFYHRARLEFELREFACEKIGLSRRYHNGEIKRLLSTAITELEGVSFLAPLPPSERFLREARGIWKAVFVSASKRDVHREAERGGDSTLQAEMVALGVKASVAEELLGEHDHEKIREKVSYTKELLRRKDKKVARNPAGFVVSAVRGDFRVPSATSRKSQTAASASPRIRQTATPAKFDTTIDAESRRVEEYWTSLDSTEQQSLEERAISNAEGFLAKQFHDGRERGGLLFEAARRAIINAEIRRLLASRP